MNYSYMGHSIFNRSKIMFYLVSSNSINIYCDNIMTTIKKLILKFQQ
jgi:hypothetical protein